MRRALLIALLCLVPRPAWADLYALSSVVRTASCQFVEGQSCAVPLIDLTGTMEISSVPTVYDRGERYIVAYAITFNFLFSDGGHIFGTGGMGIDGNGCGLFDCNMAAYAADDIAHQYLWTVGNGAFFYPDGSPYPSVFESALAYVAPPARFELYFNHLAYVSGPLDTYTAYRFMSPSIVATRIEGVPEPSTLLLAGLGLVTLVRSRGWRRHQ